MNVTCSTIGSATHKFVKPLKINSSSNSELLKITCQILSFAIEVVKRDRQMKQIIVKSNLSATAVIINVAY